MSAKSNIVQFLGKKSVLLAGTALLSASAGAFGGYVAAKSKLEPIYEERASEEIRKAKEHYDSILKLDKFSKSPEDMVKEKYGEGVEALGYAGPDKLEDRDEILDKYTKTDSQGEAYVDYSAMSTKHHIPKDDVETPENLDAVMGEPPTVRQNAFEEAAREAEEERLHQIAARDESDWDWDEVRLRREEDPYTPYVITHEEFLANEMEYLQEELSYYAGDDTLTDEQGEQILDTDNEVGNANLIAFGLMSGDPEVVYVRNEGREVEFEIRRFNLKYGDIAETVSNLDEVSGG